MGLIALLILVAYWNQVQNDKIKNKLEKQKKIREKMMEKANHYGGICYEEKPSTEWELMG